MLTADKEDYNKQTLINELLLGSGVVVFKNVYDLNDIELARELINKLASNQEFASAIAFLLNLARGI